MAFTSLCECHCVAALGLCHLPQLKLPPHQTLAPPSSLPAAPGNHCSTFYFHEFDCPWYLVWVESKAFTPLRLTYVTVDDVFKVHAAAFANISCLFQVEQHSTVHMTIYHVSSHPSVDTWVAALLRPLWIMLRTSVGVHISRWDPAFCSFGCTPRGEIYTVILVLIFRDRHTGGYRFTFPPTVHSGSHLSTFLPTLVFPFFYFDSSHPREYEVLSHSGLGLHFLSHSWCWASLCVLVGHLNVLF